MSILNLLETCLNVRARVLDTNLELKAVLPFISVTDANYAINIFTYYNVIIV